MNFLDFALEVAKLTIPGLVTAGVLALVLRSQYQAQSQQGMRKLRLKSFSSIMPLKLAAYERCLLYLDRMHPVNLIARNEPEQKPIKVLLPHLLQDIQAEYEHNVVQQLYLSEAAWSALLDARNGTIALIKDTAAALPPDAPGLILASKVFEAMKESEDYPIDRAVQLLKNDVQALFTGRF